MSKHSILLPLLLLTACSSVSTHTDYDEKADFSGLHKWAWAKPIKADVPNHAGEGALAAQRIEKAIETELAAKGFTAVEDEKQADFLVAAHAAVTKDYDSTYINSYYGYGGVGWGYAYGPPMVYQYERGSLVVNVLSAATREVMWTGSAKGVYHEDESPEDRDANVKKAVAQLMADFPPK